MERSIKALDFTADKTGTVECYVTIVERSENHASELVVKISDEDTVADIYDLVYRKAFELVLADREA